MEDGSQVKIYTISDIKLDNRPTGVKINQGISKIFENDPETRYVIISAHDIVVDASTIPYERLDQDTIIRPFILFKPNGNSIAKFRTIGQNVLAVYDVAGFIVPRKIWEMGAKFANTKMLESLPFFNFLRDNRIKVIQIPEYKISHYEHDKTLVHLILKHARWKMQNTKKDKINLKGLRKIKYFPPTLFLWNLVFWFVKAKVNGVKIIDSLWFSFFRSLWETILKAIDLQNTLKSKSLQ
jgi:hypothetical protein